MSLSHQDLLLLEQFGATLGLQLRQLLASFPPAARTINGMAKWLGYHASNCQRILQASQQTENGHQVLCQLPGQASLTQFSQLLQVKNPAPALQQQLMQQLQQWQQLSSQYFRSHAQMKRLLADSPALSPAAVAQPDRRLLRQQHFASSKNLIGSSIDSVFACYLLTESARDPQFLQEIALIGKKNYCRRAEAPPFVQFYTHPHPAHFERPLDITAESRIDPLQFQIGVIRPYSSADFLARYRSYSASNSGILFADYGAEVPFDATFLFSNPDELANPLTHQSRCSSTSISIKTPTRKLVMAVFLDKKIDIRSTVNVGCYSGNQKVEDGQLRADDMWTELLPDYPDLTILHAAAPAARVVDDIAVGEQSDFLFRFAGLQKSDFVCYFMEVDYPIWSATYRIYFQHS
jgi:hypothetical protein